ncbi:MAG: fasciclin domain-containing protein [Prevotella sp.]|nr:fasciclin domain-containing protein [Prevotella sp.]
MEKSIVGRIGLIGLIGLMGLLGSCNPEPDESDLFTATGETACDFIKRKAELSSFDYILSRVRLDRNLSSYGEYTCFAPTNEAIAIYLDSLWNDPEAPVAHNSMTENSLQGLTDSLCNDIAKYHLASGVHNTIEMGGSGSTVNTMLGRPVQTEGTSDSIGRVTLEKAAVIIEADSLVTNGIVHVLNRVIPRSTRLIVDEMERHQDYSIFVEALKMTGLADSLTKAKKNVTYTISDIKDVDANKSDLYHPEECKVMYTIFAEPNEVLEKNGINSINDLIAYANNVYGNAAEWYDYLNETGNTVSTGNDYTNRFNALNMFVAYHILYAGMPQNELVYEYNSRWSTTWNYTNGCQPFDYYETMLPCTLMKIWDVTGNRSNSSHQLYINRYRTLNTLTDELGTETAANTGALVNEYGIHELVSPGVRIARTTDSGLSFETNIQTYNGYIHGLRGMLVYDRQVPKGVLHERLRFDSTTFLVEFINNGIRMSNNSEMQALNGGGSGNRVAFPLNYFDNVVSYTPENRFRYNIKGAYNAWQSDTFQGWGNYDLAIKLPPLPTGRYEFRVFYTPMSHGGMMQFYLGTSRSLSSMEALDIPLDVRIPIDDPRIGSTTFFEEDDMGIATDAALRNRGYMRGLFSYQDHPENLDGSTTINQRSDKRNASLRKVFNVREFKQSDEHWFRIKNVIQDETDLKWQFDYVEFVPYDVVNNDTYSEDWY